MTRGFVDRIRAHAGECVEKKPKGDAFRDCLCRYPQ